MIIYGKTDKGNVRSVNEDSYCIVENDNGDFLAAVCDGIGGSAAGEQASKLAVVTMAQRFEKAAPFQKDYEVADWIRSALHQANDAIYSKSMHSKKSRGMGTTAVGCLITSIGTYIFNAGDSRLYAVYKDGMTQMTEDHSVIAQLLRENRITQEEARNHSQRNTLTNALGVWRVFRIDINKIEPDWETLLICSDGLHGYVEASEIERVLTDPLLNTEKKAEILVNMANNIGGLDNVTVVLCEKESAA